MSDQDKGSIAEVKEAVSEAFHFHCAWHPRQNIIGSCGGSSTTVNSALWTFNLLEKCKTLPSIISASEEPFSDMHPTDLHYLTKVPNEAQLPVQLVCVIWHRIDESSERGGKVGYSGRHVECDYALDSS